MRNKKVMSIAFLSMMFALCSLCTGCIGNSTPQTVYYIGAEHTFGTVSVKVEHDEIREQFVIRYDISKQDTDSWHEFHFTLSYNLNELRNSEQFEYFDESNSPIGFDENGYYIFYTSKTLYVSYKNASADIKSVIANKKCELNFGMGTFIFPPGDDCEANEE